MAARVALVFDEGKSGLMRDLSAGVRVGDTLFVANDETTAIEALDREGHIWTFAKSISLKSLIHMPGGGAAEADLEGMAADGRWVWITGSHAQVRESVSDQGPKKAVRRLSRLRRPQNRCIFARIPIVRLKDGRARLAVETESQRTQQLEAGKRSSSLIRWLSEDAMIAPFLGLGTKENGLDIEGVAAKGDNLWLGLRGPVVRGYAIVLRFEISGARRGALKAKKVEGGQRFRKNLIPPDGLGIRDLACDGDDLLVLTCPTMATDGPQTLVRWKDAESRGVSQIIDDADITVLGDLTRATGAKKPRAWYLGRMGKFLSYTIRQNLAASISKPALTGPI